MALLGFAGLALASAAAGYAPQVPAGAAPTPAYAPADVTVDRPAPPATSASILHSLTEEERAWLRAHPVITVFQDPKWPPVEFADPQGNPSGMTRDYLNLIEQRLELKFAKVQHQTWEEGYARLRRQEIDLTTSVSETPERREFWGFTKPYLTIPIVIAAHPDLTYIADMRELAGKRVAVVDGYAVADWLPRDFPEIRLVKVPTTLDGLQRLQRGEVDACIDSLLAIGYHQARRDVFNLKIAGETPYYNAQCMAVRKDWAPFLGILQKALDSISEAEREAIYRRWLPVRYEHGFNYGQLWWMPPLGGVILLILIFWNRRLAREIRIREHAQAALALEEKTSRSAEEKFRRTFELMPNPVTIQTREGILIDCNDAFCEAAGFPRAEMLNRTTHDLGLWASLDQRQSMRDTLDRDGRLDGLEIRFRRRDGEIRVMLLSARILAFASEPLVLSAAQDITERKRAEEALRLSEENLTITLQSIGDAVIATDAAGRITRMNRTAETLTGWPLTEAIGRALPDVFRIVNALTRAPAINPVQLVMERGAIVGLANHTALLARDGREYQISDSAAPIRSAEGSILGVVLVFGDVTAEYRLQQTLASTTEMLERTGAMAKVGGWELDLRTMELFWSKETCRIHEINPPVAPALDQALSFYTPENRPIIQAAVQAASEYGTPYDLELGLITAKGRSIWVRAQCSPVMEEGKVTKLLGAFHDITERKQAEETLREETQFSESVLKSLPGIFYLYTYPELHLIRWNKQHETLLGFTTAEMKDRLVTAWHRPEAEPAVRGAIDEVMAAGSNTIEAELVAKDGHLVPFLLTGVRFESQGRLYLMGIGVDITERKRAEEARRESARILRDSQAVAHIGAYVTDLTATEFAANSWQATPEIYKIFGIDETYPRTLAGWVGFIHPDSKETLFAYHQQVVAERARFDHEYKIVRINDGAERWVQGTGELEYDEQNHPIRMLGTIQDITERKRAELAMRESEQRLRLALSVAHMGYWRYEVATGAVVDNEQHGALFGIESGARNWTFNEVQQLVHPDDQAASALAMHRTLTEGESFDRTYRCILPNGEIRWMHSLGHLCRDAAGQPDYVFGVTQDITEGKRAEEEIHRLNATLEQRVRDRTTELETANKELEAFSYSVSHDLRAPLRAIDGFTRILIEDYHAHFDAEGRRLTSIICAEAKRMGELIDDLLAFSRMNRRQMEPEEVPMAELARSIFQDTTAQAPGRKFQLRLEALPPAHGDLSMLRQVLVNLISNAVKYTRPRAVAEIEIGGRTAGSENLYYVKDNGVGFDMKYAGKLFGVFRRLHTEDEFEGTGVGLALVHRVILRHGGRVWAEAVLDGGATFHFALPARSPANDEQHP